MAQTKVKRDLIDASFGNILEQVFYRADGRTVSTSQGNITVPNITSGTDITSLTLVDAPGSNIDYQPPTGASLVSYEVTCACGLHGTSNYQAPAWIINVDGTDVTSTRRGWLTQSMWDNSYQNYVLMRITGGSDNLAAEQMGTWTSAKTIKLRVATWDSSYGYRINSSYHYRPAGTGQDDQIIVPPVIKITAYS